MSRRGSAGSLLLGLLLAATPAWSQSTGPAKRLSLDDALRLAHPASEALGLARAAVARARGEELRSKSELFPQVTASASYSRLLKSQFSGLASSSESSDSSGVPRPESCDRFFADPTHPIGERVDSLEKTLECVTGLDPFGSLGNLPFGRKNTFNLGLSFSQTLFAGGRIRGQMAAAGAGRRSAEIGLTTAEAQLTLDVVQAYFDAALAVQLAAIASTAVEQADSTLKDTEQRRAVGTVPEFDLLRARVTRDNQRSFAIQRAVDRDLAILRLQQLLDLPAGQALELTTALDDSTLAGSPALAEALAARPDTSSARRAPVRQAEEAVAAQQGLVKAASAEHLPSVALTSSYGRVAYPNSGIPGWNDFLTNWSVALGLQVPLFTGGRVRGSNAVARAGLDEARIRLRQTTELAQLDAQSSLAQLGTAEEALRATQGTAEQAERAYQIADLRYREGLSTHTELLDARLALEQARGNRALSARNLQVARVRMALLASLPLSGTSAAQSVQGASASARPASTSPASSTTQPTTGTGLP